MEDYKDQRKKAIKKTIFTYLTITVIGAVLAGIGMLLRGKAEGFGIVMGLIGLIFVGVGVFEGVQRSTKNQTLILFEMRVWLYNRV